MTSGGALLSTERLSCHFGGLKAVDDLTVGFEAGEITGLIGPNGAGKTTLVNLLTGTLAPSAGDVVFGGRALRKVKPHVRAQLGIARTFQVPRPLRDMTVAENVLVGTLFGRGSGADRGSRWREVDEALGFVGLRDKGEAAVDTLSVAHRKLLELARCLATKPRMLILDEATAGLNQAERYSIVDLIERIAEEGVGVIVIEHVVEFIGRVAERVIVLDQGKLLAEGTTQAVLTDERVVEAYIGMAGASDEVGSQGA